MNSSAKALQCRSLSLTAKNVLFTTALVISLILQLALSSAQNEFVALSVYENQDRIQAISSLLNDVDRASSALEDFRWDYSDKAALVSLLRSYITSSLSVIERINADISFKNRETYLLESAVLTTFETYRNLSQRLCAYLINSDTASAATLYYSDLQPCTSYLIQYIQQYLDSTIREGSESFYNVMKLNEMLQRFSLISTLFCLSSAFIVSLSLTRLVSSVTRLAAASASISAGFLEIPDFEIEKYDEIGKMEYAFNNMKNSMRSQLRILEEKNAVEVELHKRETEALELQTLLEREKLQQLRSQINPHFLFNTLNAITYSAQNEKASETEKLLTSLAMFFRYTLASNDAEVLLSSEVRNINEYYALICARFGSRMGIKWDYPSSMDLTTVLVPSFMIQPLVENAIKHGLSRKENGGNVKIKITTEKDILFITVSDDGVGMSREKLESVRSKLTTEPQKGSQVGLYNVAARLALMGKKCGIRIESVENTGTDITIFFPLKEKCEDVQDTDC